MLRAMEEYPAAERNKAPILEQLIALLPERGTVLEIASGTGQHVVAFAARLPALYWQPSDMESVMYDIENGMSVDDAAAKWISANPEKVSKITGK